jgi:hypothetical protein
MSQESLVEYRALLDLYLRAAETMAGREFRGEGAWIVEAEHLAAKLFCCSAVLSPGVAALPQAWDEVTLRRDGSLL